MTKYAAFNEVDKGIAMGKSIELTPTDGLGISNSDLDQIGAKSYAEVDAILQDFLAYNEMFSSTTKKVNADRYLEYNALYDIEPEVIKKVLDRHIASEFTYTPMTNRTYPYLGISITGDGVLIILFSSPNTGTVVGITGSRPNKLGSYSKSWAEEVFEIFTGEVKLSN